MIFLFNYASRSRPNNFFRGLDSIVNNMSGLNDYYIVASLDEDDASMNNDGVIKRMNSYGNLKYYFGKSKNKIDAINREIKNFPDKWDVLLNMSDDMVFVSRNFDENIRESVSALGGLDVYLHYPDTNHKSIGALTTLHIVGREYFERDGFVYSPRFISVYCDNWNDYLAKKRGRYYIVDKVIFDHKHPAYGKADKDAQYLVTEDRKTYVKDRATFNLMKQEDQ